MARITFQFGTGESGNAYLAQGWTSPQPTFVWATGPVSELVLPTGRWRSCNRPTSWRSGSALSSMASMSGG